MTTRQLKIGYLARRQYRSFAAFSWRWVMGLITLSLGVFILAVRTGALVSSGLTSPADPFAFYRPLMSGQPPTILEDYGCTYQSEPTCHIYPEDRSFHDIKVTILLGRIAEISFYSESLQLGDLIHQLGRTGFDAKKSGWPCHYNGLVDRDTSVCGGHASAWDTTSCATRYRANKEVNVVFPDHFDVEFTAVLFPEPFCFT